MMASKGSVVSEQWRMWRTHGAVSRRVVLACAACLALLVAACGEARPLPAPPSGLSSPTSPPAQSAPPSLTFNNSGQSSQDGLTISGLFDCAHNLVLASNQLSYSDADIQGLLNYLAAFTTSGPPAGSSPAFLTWEPGSLVDTRPIAWSVSPCQAQLNVTNTSDQAITITGGGVRNSSAPAANATRYATVDVCDLQMQGRIASNAVLSWCNNGAGQGCSYGLGVALGGGNVGTDYTNSFSTEGCTTISLPAHQSVDITMLFDSGQAMIYTVVPELTVTDGSGTHAVVFSDWTNSLVFTTADQMPCYGLQQDTFSLEPAPAAACS